MKNHHVGWIGANDGLHSGQNDAWSSKNAKKHTGKANIDTQKKSTKKSRLRWVSGWASILGNSTWSKQDLIMAQAATQD